jgi:hypothetical protein
MKTIWKFPIETTDVQDVMMPAGARILCVQVQNGVPCLWAVVEPNNCEARRCIRVFGTGGDAHDQGDYIGTYQLANGALVLHVFAD